MTDIRTARILGDPSWYGGVIAAVFIADADLQYHDTQNAYRVLYEAIHRTHGSTNRSKPSNLETDESHRYEMTLDAVARVLLGGHVDAFVRAAVNAQAHLAANNPAAAYHTLATVMAAALGQGDSRNIAPQSVSAA